MNYIGQSPEGQRRERERENEQLKETLSYPVGDSTMKERRNVLTASLLGILVVYVGIVPESLPVFGVEFSANEQENLLIPLLLIIVYFTVSFWVRAFSDVTALILGSGRAKNGDRTKVVKTIASIFSLRLMIDVGVPLITALTALVGLGLEIAG